MAPKRPFTIFVGETTQTVRGRKDAVHTAKDISRKTGRPIRLERGDGHVMMEFRRGHLESYQFETRGRR